MQKSDQQKRIARELKKLHSLFSALPANEKKFIEPLLRNAAFMAVTLEDLAAEISEEGVVDEYQNGANQFGKKASATIQAYNSTMKTYHNLMDKLRDRLPKEQRKSALAELLDGDGE